MNTDNIKDLKDISKSDLISFTSLMIDILESANNDWPGDLIDSGVFNHEEVDIIIRISNMIFNHKNAKYITLKKEYLKRFLITRQDKIQKIINNNICNPLQIKKIVPIFVSH